MPNHRATSDPPTHVVELLVEFGSALHRYGTPAHHLEETLVQVAQKLGVSARVFSMPTLLMLELGDAPHTVVRLLRVAPGGLHLDKLGRVYGVARAIIEGRLSPADALDKLRQELGAPTLYPAWMQVAAFGLSSACAAPFFGGTGWEILLAAIAGLAIGGLAAAMGPRRATARVFEPTAAVTAAIVATIGGSLVVGPYSLYATVVSALIALVPGLTLTIAMVEVGTLNLASGAARLTHVAMILLLLGVGLGAGVVLADAFGVTPPPDVGRSPELWMLSLAAVWSVFSFSVILNADYDDVLPSLVIALAALVASDYLGRSFAPHLGAFGGAFTAGVLSHVHGRLRKRPSVITVAPGILLLVPGSFGFQAVTLFMASDTVAAMDTVFAMGMTAAALAAGLLSANVVFARRPALGEP